MENTRRLWLHNMLLTTGRLLVLATPWSWSDSQITQNAYHASAKCTNVDVFCKECMQKPCWRDKISVKRTKIKYGNDCLCAQENNEHMRMPLFHSLRSSIDQKHSGKIPWGNAWDEEIKTVRVKPHILTQKVNSLPVSASVMLFLLEREPL